MDINLHWCSWIVLILVSIGDVYPGNGFPTIQSQHLPQGLSVGRDTLPVPLQQHPGQPGYIIIPKANFKLPHNVPPPNSGNPHERQLPRRPPHLHPNKPISTDRQPSASIQKPVRRLPPSTPQKNEKTLHGGQNGFQRQPISSHVLPQNDRVRFSNNPVPPPHSGRPPSHLPSSQKAKEHPNPNPQPKQNAHQQNPQKIGRVPPKNIIFGPTIKFNYNKQHAHPLQHRQKPLRLHHNIPLHSQILEAHQLQQYGAIRPPSPEINLAHFLHDDPSLHLSSKFLFNGPPPKREPTKEKNTLPHSKKSAQHLPVLIPNHNQPTNEADEEKQRQELILPQGEVVLPLDIAHLLSSEEENDILDNEDEEFSEAESSHENSPAHSNAVGKSAIEPKNSGQHNNEHHQHSLASAGSQHSNNEHHQRSPFASAQTQNIPAHQHANDESRRSHEVYHIPFADFAEPEPGPQIRPSNFKPPTSHTSNRILSPHETNHKAGDSSESNNYEDQDYRIQEESAPVSLYGQVLPPDDATYSSEINNFPGVNEIPNHEAWPLPMPEMPKIVNLDVKCAKNLMRISIDFDKPFHGIIYSKGHYSYGRCVHLPAGSGHRSVNFDISVNSCGMHGNLASGNYGPTETGSYFENIVIVQYDPLVQEVWDQARKLRCNWHDQYEKTVTFRPFNVDMLQVVRADFAGDNVGCWMQIQVGKGPWASEVSGIVRIGQTMTLVLAIKDEENKFDMLVRNCIAHDGNRAPIELVDSDGCITRPKLMSRFTKVKNFGSTASVLSFAHFQAFKFPDSTDVHIQCTVQICRGECLEQCSSLNRRRKRDTLTETREVGLNSVLQVVAVEDLTFSPFTNDSHSRTPEITGEEERDAVCMSKSGFAASLILLLSVVIIACLVASFLCLRQRVEGQIPLQMSPYDLAVFKKRMHMEMKARNTKNPRKV